MKKIAHKLFSPGFTMIEILVVMAIIGILAAVGLGSFQSSQQKGRDARRKSELRQVGNALEAYYNDKGQYPMSSAGNEIDGCALAATCNWGEPFEDENGTVYMIELPEENTALNNYFYESDGTYWQLYARLENTRDRDILTDVNDNPQNYGISCGSDNCNFGISSPNTTPDAGRTLLVE